MAGLVKSGAQKNLNKINVLFAEDKSTIRATIRNVLSQEGLTQIRDYMRLDPVRAALSADMPDLLIIDSELEDRVGNAVGLVRDIRHGKLGKNPYLPIISTLWSNEAGLIGRIVDAGTDDILLKPFSPNDMMTRIKGLINNRKEFIVTSDYIGPDRRKDSERGSKITSMAVPNTLSLKASGRDISFSDLSAAVGAVNAQVNEMKMQRNAFQIAFLVEMLQPKLIAGEVSKEMADLLKRLHKMASDTAARLYNTKYEHVSEICETMTSISLSLQENIMSPSQKDIKLMKPISDAILLAFNPNSDAESLASQISGAVSGFQGRKAENEKKKKEALAKEKALGN